MEGYNNLSEIESTMTEAGTDDPLVDWTLNRSVDDDGVFERFYSFGDWGHSTWCDPETDDPTPEKTIYMEGTVSDEGTVIHVSYWERDIDGGVGGGIGDSCECDSRVEALVMARNYARQLSD